MDILFGILHVIVFLLSLPILLIAGVFMFCSLTNKLTIQYSNKPGTKQLANGKQRFITFVVCSCSLYIGYLMFVY